jgi:hypothetical protein
MNAFLFGLPVSISGELHCFSPPINDSASMQDAMSSWSSLIELVLTVEYVDSILHPKDRVADVGVKVKYTDDVLNFGFNTG